MKTSLRLLIIACSGLILSACSSFFHSQPVTTAPDITRRPPETSHTTVKEDEPQRLSVDDVISIKVFQVPDLSRKVRVDGNGDITFPLIGKIQARGLTTSELETQIAERLGNRYIRDPQVSVFVKEFITQRITVQGVVKKPGIFPIKGKTTLIQAIALADGTDDTFSLGDLKQIHLYRKVGGGKKDLYVYDLDGIYHGQISDPLVMNEDVIVVPKNPLRSRMKAIGDTVRNIVYFTIGASVPLFGN